MRDDSMPSRRPQECNYDIWALCFIYIYGNWSSITVPKVCRGSDSEVVGVDIIVECCVIRREVKLLMGLHAQINNFYILKFKIFR